MFVPVSVLLESATFKRSVGACSNPNQSSVSGWQTREGESLRKGDAAWEANSLEETEFLFDSDLIKKPSFFADVISDIVRPKTILAL